MASSTKAGYVVTSRTEVGRRMRSEEHTSELQSRSDLVCRLLLEKKKTKDIATTPSRDHGDHEPVLVVQTVDLLHCDRADRLCVPLRFAATDDTKHGRATAAVAAE